MITCSQITLRYKADAAPILSNFNFTLEKGEFGLITGPSGCGKSTLVKVLTSEMQPESGTITIGPYEVTRLPKAQRPRYRQSIGVIFQDLKLLKDKTIFENIALPLELQNRFNKKQIAEKVWSTLERLDLLSEKDAY